MSHRTPLVDRILEIMGYEPPCGILMNWSLTAVTSLGIKSCANWFSCNEEDRDDHVEECRLYCLPFCPDRRHADNPTGEAEVYTNAPVSTTKASIGQKKRIAPVNRDGRAKSPSRRKGRSRDSRWI